MIIIGGGVAGISCARALHAAGRPFTLLEAGDALGGRVRTDRTDDGFLLDRGFQVLLTAYPEAQAQLDFAKLDLCKFSPGALSFFEGKFHRFADPWKAPRWAIATAFSRVGTLADKLRVCRLRSRLLENHQSGAEYQTIEALQLERFSEQILRRFFKPFFGGVFFDRELRTSQQMFEFVFRMFALGDVTLPRLGMEQIPRQLAAILPPESIRLNSRVKELTTEGVLLESGELLQSYTTVIATDIQDCARLLKLPKIPQMLGCVNLYFAADHAPIGEPILLLNGEGRGPINNISVLSNISSKYAPSGAALISVTVLGQPSEDELPLVAAVRAQLREWFGEQVLGWRHLRSYFIPRGLPVQYPPYFSGARMPINPRASIFICGDHLVNGSLQGALLSGRKTAEAILGESR